MYALASQLLNLPIVSLQTGQTVAVAGRPIVNPDTLSLVALYCQAGRFRPGNAVLLVRDIRQVGSDGIVIDSFEDIEDASEIVRLGSVIQQRFNPIGIAVINESGQRLGKVEEYTVNLDNYQIQKLYLKQSVIKNLLLNNLVVDRTQIIDVKPRQITVRDATVKESLMAAVPALPD